LTIKLLHPQVARSTDLQLPASERLRVWRVSDATGSQVPAGVCSAATLNFEERLLNFEVRTSNFEKKERDRTARAVLSLKFEV
jgi:hypothetical protein